MDVNYRQSVKCKVRHTVLGSAVSSLTNSRNEATCVSRTYLRELTDYFCEDVGSKNAVEAKKVSSNCIVQWESFYDATIATKKVSDLTVFYLAGPEPQNDFNELISLGILPQNIWAIESKKSCFDAAISAYSTESIIQPKIIKGKIERFFLDIPKKFDIVYLDACGSVASDKKVLKMLATLIDQHKLISPGCVITNFSNPDVSKEEISDEYCNLIASYLYHKKDFFRDIKHDEKSLDIIIEYIEKCTCIVKDQFEFYYGEFITRVIMDISSTIIPTQRFVNSFFINNLFVKNEIEEIVNSIEYSFEGYKRIKNNPVYSFIYLSKLLNGSDDMKDRRIQKFITELRSTADCGYDMYDSFAVREVLGEMSHSNDNIFKLKKTFQNANIHQFLDKPNPKLILDIIVNQIAFPYHYNTEKVERYKYKAKKTKMYIDVFFLDECRYLYEWLPTLDFLSNLLRDEEWQYSYRFVLDGLIKQRINYNTDYFYGGSVISKRNNKFGSKTMVPRKEWE